VNRSAAFPPGAGETSPRHGIKPSAERTWHPDRSASHREDRPSVPVTPIRPIDEPQPTVDLPVLA